MVRPCLSDQGAQLQTRREGWLNLQILSVTIARRAWMRSSAPSIFPLSPIASHFVFLAAALFRKLYQAGDIRQTLKSALFAFLPRGLPQKLPERTMHTWGGGKETRVVGRRGEGFLFPTPPNFYFFSPSGFAFFPTLRQMWSDADAGGPSHRSQFCSSRNPGWRK